MNHQNFSMANDFELEKYEAKINELEQSLESLNDKHRSTQRLLKKTQEEKEELEDDVDDLSRKLKKKSKEVQEKEEIIEDINKGIQHKDCEIEKLNEEIENNKLRENLIGSLISAKNENKEIARFSELLNNDFLKKNEAEAFLKLQEIESELKMLSIFPAFFSKRSIAVAGGFSSGKSAFISSFFQNKNSELPSDVSPTTAIPTYVLTDKPDYINSTSKTKKYNLENQLIGISHNGGSVDLLKIDPKLIGKLQHSFLQSFNFPLKDIMPYMFFITSLPYKHICFIDTPGYNPATSKVAFTSQDINSAKESLKGCEAILWLIGADANGTIPKTDLDFLKEVMGKKPIYFVLNKADLKTKNEINQILTEFQNTLKTNNINYIGVSAFSSIENKELSHKKCSLWEFLNSLNKPSDKQEYLIKKLYEVDQIYQFTIKKNIKERKSLAKAFDDIAYHLNMEDFAEGEHYIYNALDDIKLSFNITEQKNQLKELDILIEKLKETIDNIFDKKSRVRRISIDADNIEVKTWNLDNGNYESSFIDAMNEVLNLGRELKETIKKNNLSGEIKNLGQNGLDFIKRSFEENKK